MTYQGPLWVDLCIVLLNISEHNPNSVEVLVYMLSSIIIFFQWSRTAAWLKTHNRIAYHLRVDLRSAVAEKPFNTPFHLTPNVGHGNGKREQPDKI